MSDNREFVIYWCPRCKIRTESSWHTCAHVPLIPQANTETKCEVIETVPKTRVVASEERIAKLEIKLMQRQMAYDLQLGAAAEAGANAQSLLDIVEWYADPNNYGDEGDAGEWIYHAADLEHTEGYCEWEPDCGERARKIILDVLEKKGQNV